MSIASYTDLQTYLASYLGKSSDTTITAAAPDFITLAEARIAYGAGRGEDDPYASQPLRIRAMETSIPLVITLAQAMTTTAGTANSITCTNTTPISSLVFGTHISCVPTTTNTGATTLAVDSTGTIAVRLGSARAALQGGEIVAGATYEFYYDGTYWVLMPTSADVPLPANYLAFRSIYIDMDPRLSPTYLTPTQFNIRYASTSIQGPPDAYTIEADAVQFGPEPDKTYYGWTIYYKQFPALASAAGGTNWLMTNYPNVYLYAALLEADIFLQDVGEVPMIDRHFALFRASIDGLQGTDERDRHSGPITMTPAGTVW